MNVNDLKQSRFLTQHEVDPPVLATIKGCEQMNVAKEGAPEDLKWVMTFEEIEKPLVLNSTNGQIIAQICGSEESDDWIGKKIVLFRDPNIFFGNKMVGGVRVRVSKQGTTKARPQAQPEPVNNSDIPF